MAGKFDPKTFLTKPHQQKVIKPWGYEIIYSPPNAPTVGKILHLKAGHKLSLQWHDQKTETLCLIKGQAKYILENNKNQLKEIDMELNKGYFNNPGQTHRIIAITDCDIIESSTPETGNTFRVKDEYKRDSETEKMRKMENRGWEK
jgi:mannose-6-phosphate isomerase